MQVGFEKNAMGDTLNAQQMTDSTIEGYMTRKRNEIEDKLYGVYTGLFKRWNWYSGCIDSGMVIV